MKLPITVTVALLVFLLCLYRFSRTLKKARSSLSGDDLKKIEDQTNVSFLNLIVPAVPLLAAYFVQDYLPIHPVLTVSIAFVISVFLIWLQQLRTTRDYRSAGVASTYISAHNTATAYLWVGIIVFVAAYTLTELGWVS